MKGRKEDWGLGGQEEAKRNWARRTRGAYPEICGPGIEV